MLINELHQGGIRALLAWDGSIFDNMQLPEGVALADVADRIIYKYGDTPLMTPDPAVIKFYIGRWSKRRLPLWERYKAAIELEYNPIENYDRQELHTRRPNLQKVQSGSVTEAHSGTITDAHTGTITDAHTGTVTDAHTGTVTTNNNGDTTDQRAADNSSAWENFDKTNVNLTDRTTNALQDQRTHANNDTRTHANNDTRTHANTDTTTYNNVTEAESGTDTTESRIHGNIGVLTSQAMLVSELDLIPRLDLIDYIADDWHNEFCLLMY